MRRLVSLIGASAILLAGCSTPTTPSTAAAATAVASAPPSAPAPTFLVAVTATPSSSVSSGPSATATPVAASPTADGWRPAPSQDAVSGAQFQNVVWTGTRFVATGVALVGNGGVFLDSSDGVTWHTQPVPLAGQPFRLAAGSRGVVAVGHGSRPTSWFSSDGLNWTGGSTALPATPSGTDGFDVMDVVATTTGWLAVGREDPYCNVNCGLAPVRSLVWTSGDGLTWTRVPDQVSFDGGGMNAVVRGSVGLVAVGFAGGHGAVWTSNDGSAWARVPDAPIFHPQPATDPSSSADMSGVAAGPGVIAIVGMAHGVGPGGAPSVLAWWSADGRKWVQATGDRFLYGQVFEVATTPRGFLATGPSGDQSCLGGIWASTDGRSWRCVASDDAFTGFGPYAAAASSTVEIAVGLTSVGLDPNGSTGLPGAVWWRPIP